MDDKWFYENEDYYTAAWSTAREHYPYMSGVGKAIENPGSKDIKKGSPVYYSNGDHIVHTTICVGENSAGTPIINSHNNDYYHVRWNYWGESTTYYTVQIPTSGYKRPSVDIVVEPGSAGDVDADGRVTANDALLVLKNVVGLNEFSDEESVSADLDLDGEITANDALQILKKVVGLA